MLCFFVSEGLSGTYCSHNKDVEWKQRLTLSLYVTILKIGMVELFFLLNFSLFSYSHLPYNALLTYLTFGGIYFLLYYSASYLSRLIRIINHKRTVFLIIATSVFLIKILIFQVCGYLPNSMDPPTIFTLLFVETVCEFTFGFSLEDPKRPVRKPN